MRISLLSRHSILYPTFCAVKRQKQLELRMSLLRTGSILYPMLCAVISKKKTVEMRMSLLRRRSILNPPLCAVIYSMSKATRGEGELTAQAQHSVPNSLRSGTSKASIFALILRF